MGIFGKTKGRAVKFDFYVQIHSLSPWPAQYAYLAIVWSRGTTHKGQTKVTGPTSGPAGGAAAVFSFNEGFHLPCTLYEVRPAPLQACSSPPCQPVDYHSARNNHLWQCATSLQVLSFK